MYDENDKTEKRISAELPDWSREKPRRFWDPSRKLLFAIRRYQYWNNRSGLVASFMIKIIVLRHRFWGIVTGADIPLNCDIGGGLLIPHPNGIVIHPDARIGVNCLIFQQVTIGTRETAGAPVIEGHVDIGAGAKILGLVRVGGACASWCKCRRVEQTFQVGPLQLEYPPNLSTHLPANSIRITP